MDSARHVVKRRGHTEPYDREKLHASICAVSLAAGEVFWDVHFLAEETIEEVEAWLEAKYEVTSNDIRRVAAEALAKNSNDAALLYRTQRMLN